MKKKTIISGVLFTIALVAALTLALVLVATPVLAVVEYLDITTESLPDGQTGAYYENPIIIDKSGVTPPYAWAITDGTMPAGLALGFDPLLDGASIWGTPTASGVYNFTVKVNDSGVPQLWDEQEFTITINPSVLNVPAGYPTIQEAITAAYSGDTINVASGTYDENLIIDKSLALQGEDADDTIIMGTGGTAVTINADSVTIIHFTISNPSGKHGIYAQDHNNITITDNNITNVGTSDATTSGTNFGIGIVSSSAAVDNIDITYNHINNVAGGNFKSAAGIAIGWSNGSNDVTNLLVQNNIISDITSDDTVPYASGGRGAYGIIINHAGPSAGGRTVSPQILDNTISNLSGLWSHGIGLEGNTPNALVQGNTISLLSSTKHLLESEPNNWNDAVAVMIEDNPSATTATINGNKFSDIAYGVVNVSVPEYVNATKNYWGTDDGDTANDGDTIRGMIRGGIVIYAPWYTDENMTTLDSDLQVHNTTQGTDHATIQEAINFASEGDTIEVDAGTYINDPYDSSMSVPDSYRITKSITLRGAQAGVDPEGSTDRGNETILVRTNGTPYSLYASDITIDGFTFTSGEGSGGGRLIIAGDNVIIQNCIIKDVSGTDSHGLWIAGEATDALIDQNTFSNTAWEAITCDGNATITNNTIKDIFTNKGINLNATSITTIEYNVISNTFYEGIFCAGTSDISQNNISSAYKGISIRETGSATVNNNTIADIEWEGIEVLGSATISYNDISNAYKGISLAGTSDATVNNNIVYNTTYEGIQAYAATTIQDNEIYGCYHGIQIRDDATGWVIEGNDIHDNLVHGIEIPNYDESVTVTGATIRFNSFDGNGGWGIYTGGTGDGSELHINQNEFTGVTGNALTAPSLSVALDATGNWWGSTASPAAKISGNVDYSPWWGASYVGDDHSSPWTWYTNDNIQEAMNAASDYDTINVLAGLYDERITITKPITLLGATHGVNKNGYAVPDDYAWDLTKETVINNPTPEATALVSVVWIENTNDVTFDGFVVQSLNAPQSSVNDMLVTLWGKPAAMNNIKVINNVIGPNTNVTPGQQNGTAGRMGLYLATPRYPADGAGITNSTFSGNKIFDCLGNGNNVFVWGAAKSYNSPANADYTGTIIEDNEICGSHRSGIEIAGGVDNLIILNNDIHDNSDLNSGVVEEVAGNQKYGNGIAIIRMGSDKTFSDAMGADNLQITGNNIYNNEKNGIYLGPINTNYTFSNNNIYNNGWDGVRLDLTEIYDGRDPANAVYDVADNITAYSNKIYDNDGYGVQVIGTPTNGFVLNAARNWWDTNDSVAIQGKVSGKVVYAPWYTDESMTETDSDLKVHNITQGTDHATIQEAIDFAVDGDTISVDAGTYSESVLIDKPLTLTGAGATKPVITGLAPADYIIKIDATTGVTLDNLEINGGGTARGDNAFAAGILVNSSGASDDPVEISNSIVQNIWKTSADGIFVTGASYVDIHGNTIQSFDKRGIRLLMSDGEIYDNEIIGDNVDGTSRVQDLIVLWSGSNAGIYSNILHNALTIDGMTPTWDSPAILVCAYNAGVLEVASHADIHDNEIYDSDTGIVVGSVYTGGSVDGTDSSSAAITNNNLHDLNVGVSFEQTSVTATINHNSFASSVVTFLSAAGLATTPSIDITQNYWSTAVASTIQSKIDTSVSATFIPYYVDAALTILNTTEPGSVYVSQTYTDGEAGGHIFGYDAFNIIQEGIDAVYSEGTVNVAAGEYEESVYIEESITLLATEGAEHTSIIGTFFGAVIAIDGACSVTLDGFDISEAEYGVFMEAVAPWAEINIRNCHIHDTMNGIQVGDFMGGPIFGTLNIQDNIIAGNACGIDIDSVDEGTVSIHDNIISENEYPGIYIGGILDESSVTIQGNWITGNSYGSESPEDIAGIYVDYIEYSELDISDNTITGNAYDGIWIDEVVYESSVTIQNNEITENGDIMFGGIYFSIISSDSEVTIQNNTIEDNNEYGIYIENIREALLTVNINGNVISGNDDGIYIGFIVDSTLNITRNTITNNDNGLHFDEEIVDSTINILENSFTGNTEYGIYNGTGTDIDATHNWWGTTDGEVISGMVSGDVDYNPWHLKTLDAGTVADTEKTTTSVILTWTAEGTWPEDYYDFRYSTSSLSDANWAAAKKVIGEPAPDEGTQQQMIIRNLNSNTTYYFGLVITDGTNRSDISIVEVTTDAVVVPDTTPPDAVTGLTASTVDPKATSVKLTWTATGDDGTTGGASKYIIKRSIADITTDAEFNAATTVFNNLAPKVPGEQETFTVTRLNPGFTYYFAVKAVDEAENKSSFSKASCTTESNLPAVTGITADVSGTDNDEARTIIITGDNLQAGMAVVRLVKGADIVTLTNVTVNNDEEITAVVPVGAPVGTYKARVINNNGTSMLGGTYTVTQAPDPLPVVTNVIPNLATSGTSTSGVKIFGQHFTGATAVTVGGQPADSFTVNSDTKITADIPGLSAGEYDVRVTTPAGTNDISAVKFIVSDPVTATDDDTTTSGIVDLGGTGGTTQGQITLTTDNSENATQNTDADAEIEVVIPPDTSITDNDGNPYTGTLNPPRVVKPDTTVQTGLPEDSLVIEMGNPDQTINFSQPFVTTVTVAGTSAPGIYYYNKDTGLYELAGIDGEKDGVTYVPGGVVLNTESITDTENIYTIGLLLDHMSVYVASTESLLPAPPAPTPGGGGGGASPSGTTNVRGKVSSTGRFLERVVATTIDGTCSLTIPFGTVGLDKNLKPLTSITILSTSLPQSLPENWNAIGLPYDFGPSGASFDPAIILTWKYKAVNLPANAAEEDLKLAYYDETAGEWVVLDCTIDSVNNVITAKLTHFTIFALVEIPKAAAFTIGSLVISPAEVTTGETAAITAIVTNTGNKEGSYTVVLLINGVKEAEKIVTIAAGGSQDVSFDIVKETAGTYSIDLNGITSILTVKSTLSPEPVQEPETGPGAEQVPIVTPAPPSTTPAQTQTVTPEPGTNWAVIWGVIVFIVIIAVSTILIIRRRRV